jgi:hypothetical protein
MRDETRNALKLFVEKADKLLSGGYVRYLQEHGGTSLGYHFTKEVEGEEIKEGGSFTIEYKHPDNDAIEAFVLTFRFFIQQNERISFKSLADNALNDPGLSQEWKDEFVKVRDSLNAYLDSNTFITERVVGVVKDRDTGEDRHIDESHVITHRELMETFVYGGLAHANEEKMRVYKRWQGNPLGGFQFMQSVFDDVLMRVLSHIRYVAWLCEQELTGQKIQPSQPSQPPTP